MYHKKYALIIVPFILCAVCFFWKGPFIEMMTEEQDVDIPLPQVDKTESLKSLMEKHLEDHKELSEAIPEPVKSTANTKADILQENVITHETPSNKINEPVKIVSITPNTGSNANSYIVKSIT